MRIEVDKERLVFVLGKAKSYDRCPQDREIGKTEFCEGVYFFPDTRTRCNECWMDFVLNDRDTKLKQYQWQVSKFSKKE